METENNSFTFLLIPWEYDKPIQSIEIDYSENHQNQQQDEDGIKGIFSGGGDEMPKHIYTFLDQSKFQIEVTPLKRMAPPAPPTSTSSNGMNADVDEKTLMDAAGVYAYYCLNSDMSYKFANIRATKLSMACGLFSQRFYGDVFISRLGYFRPRGNRRRNGSKVEVGESGSGSGHVAVEQQQQQLQMMNKSISIEEIKYAAYLSPDLRKDIVLSLLRSSKPQTTKNETKDDNDNDAPLEESDINFPNWLINAAKNNYEDSASLSILAASMNKHQEKNNIDDEDEEEVDNGDSSNHGDHDDKGYKPSDTKTITINDQSSSRNKELPKKTIAVQTTLCLHCRCPCKNKCPDCEGMYICGAPKQCRENG